MAGVTTYSCTKCRPIDTEIIQAYEILSNTSKLVSEQEADRVTAEQGRVAAENERERVFGLDHGTATDDHATAVSDHGIAGDDHLLAVADHGTAGDDHTLAEGDHTRAGEDHLASTSATSRANNAAAAAEHMVDLHQGPPGEDGKSPYIGLNGNWYVWDDTTQQYVDSGERAQGRDGNPGSSQAYPFELVNNEETNDSTKAHTAAGAKRLKDELTQLDLKVYGATKSYPNDSGLTDIYSGYQIKVPTSGTALSATTRAAGANYRNYRVPVKFGDRVASKVIYNSYASTSGYGSMFVDANDDVISGHSRQSSESNPITLAVPSNAVQFIWSINLSNSDTFNTIQVIFEPDKIPTSKIEDSAVTTPKIADGAVTRNKIADGVISDAISDTPSMYISYNRMDASKLQRGYISKSTGNFNSLTSGTTHATGFIPVSTNGLYCYCRVPYGSVGDGAVYDADKHFLRALTSDTYTYVEGDAFVRWTIKTDNGYQCVLDGSQLNIVGTFNPTYKEQIVTPFNGEQVFAKESIPSLIPAFSSVGQDGVHASIASLDSSSGTDDGKRLRSDSFSGYLKSYHIVTASMKFSSGVVVRVGYGYQISNGVFAEIDSTSVKIRNYTGNGDTATILKSQNHGLTLSGFLVVVFETTPTTMAAKIMTSDGAFVCELDESSIRESYGLPFVEAYSGVITDVELRCVSDRFRLPVWVIGDSYVSLYEKRWTYQMMSAFGENDFLVCGLAGAKSEDMYPKLTKLLNFGTPKYLVWALGMNDTYPWRYKDYLIKVEMDCRARGIELILTTIPYPTGDTRATINQFVKESGYRYIDVYSAVSSDANGTWYAGMNDDGVHPTALGAKAIAARVLADFPEITH